jgi:hypothetical protein
MSNGRRVPPTGSPTPPRGPRPPGFYGRGADYDQTAGGARADGRSRGPAGRGGQPDPQYAQQYYGQPYYGQAEDQYGQTAPGREHGQAPAGGWPRQGHDQYGGAGPYGQGQPRADQYGPQQSGQPTGRPSPGQPGQATSDPRQPRYGAEYPGAGPDPFQSTGYGPSGQPGQGQYGPAAGQGQYGPGQYGQAQYGPGPQAADEFGRHPRNTGSWQAAGPAGGQNWAGGQGQYSEDPRNTGSWQAAPGQSWAGGHGQPRPGQGHGQAWTAGPGQYGPDPRSTGSWQAAGSWQEAGPEYGQNWTADQGQYAQDPRNTGSWQAAGPTPGQTWVAGPGQPGPGQAGPGVHHTGSWQAAGPTPGTDWAAGPGRDPGVHTTGSWQATGQPQGPGWTGQEQYGSGARNTGSWQAAGATPSQNWTGPGQPPFHGQPYPGHPYPGQTPQEGRFGDPIYGAAPGGAGPGMRTTGSFGRAGGPVIRQRDSALPDPPQGSKGVIAAIETDNIAAFARDLRVLRAKAGLDYPDMAEKSHYTMRTLASAAGGLRLPTLPVLIAYVNACDGDVGEWEERWDRLMKSGKKGSIALPPAAAPDGGEPGATEGGRSRIPPEARRTGEIYVITSAKDRDDRW